MINWIFKVFIKDYKNTADKNVRRKYGMLGGLVGIFLNVCLFVIKLFAGIFTSSIGIIADAFNNLSDAGSSVITHLGFKLSGKPADNDHPFGHGRIEYLSAMWVSIVILLVGFELLKSSFGKIISPDDIIFSKSSVIILIIAILVKIWMYIFNTAIGKTIDSQTLKAAAKDSLCDCISTVTVLAGLICSKLLNVNIDGYSGLIVALFILYTGYQTIKESLSPLLGNPPDEELVKEIENTVLNHDEIMGIHDLVIHDYGPTRFMMSIHAEVSAKSNILEMHDKIDLIEKELCEKFDCEAIIHMDPIETDNEIINTLKPMLENFAANIDKSITMHDLRVVSGPTHTNIIFDVVIPYQVKIKDSEITKMLSDYVQSINSTFYAVINVDKTKIK